MSLFSSSFRRQLSSFLGCGAFLVVLVGGCETPPQPKNAQPKNVQPKKAQIDQLTYADESVRKRLLSFDAMAREIAKPNWHHKSWHKVTNGSGPNPYVAYRAIWSTHTEKKEFVLRPTTSGFHRIRLSVPVDRKDGKTVKQFVLNAIWFPNPKQWGVSINYHALPKSKELYHIHFYPGKYRFDSGTLRTYETYKQFGDYRYCIHISVPQTEVHPDIRGYLVSAKSFRDSGLASLDKLDGLVQKRIESGAAVAYVTDAKKRKTKIVNRTSAGRPPFKINVPIKFRPPLPERYKLSPAQTKQILGEAKKELDRRRKVLREHYEAMYAATQKAFPLAKCLELKR